MTKDTPEAYVAAAPEGFGDTLVRLRAQLARALPDAEEVMAYGMPGFRIDGVIVAGYAAFSRTCGLYVDPRAIAAHATELAALRLQATKTGVTFSPSRPPPESLVMSLARRSRHEQGL